MNDGARVIFAQAVRLAANPATQGIFRRRFCALSLSFVRDPLISFSDNQKEPLAVLRWFDCDFFVAVDRIPRVEYSRARNLDDLSRGENARRHHTISGNPQ